MTKLFLKLSGVAILLTLLIATGCNDEDDPIIDPLGPEIALNAEAGFVSTDVDLQENESFMVKVTVTPGDNPLSALTLLVDGAPVTANNIEDYVLSITADAEVLDPPYNNPQSIDASRQSGATYTYELVPFGQMLDETFTYSFRVQDMATPPQTASVSFDVTIVPPPGTPIDMEISGALLNQAGPAGTGGLDLDTGTGTGSANASAEIQDEGINLDLTAANNWRQQISGVNGTVLRTPDLTKLPEDFSFDNVTTKEQIKEAFDTGLALTGNDAACNCTDGTAGEEVSEPVAVGDMFIVRKGDVYYMIMATAVNVITTSNGDNYQFDIKY